MNDPSRPADPPPFLTPKRIMVLGVAAIILGGGFFLLALLKPATRAVTDQKLQADSAEEALESALQALYREADLTSCRGAIQQINVGLSLDLKKKPSALENTERTFLKERFGLDDNELAEVNSTTFTLLDAHYLDQCFLFRDAARSLELQGLSPPDQAAAAFAWVVRQVRLGTGEEDLLPPQVVLRRGWGTPEERTLVFLALLDQMGLDGCMISFPQKDRMQSWVPGVLVDRDIYLFDTRLGMPLPGPSAPGNLMAALAASPDQTFPGNLPWAALYWGGRGAGRSPVATLAEVRAQPALLQQLTIDPKFPYDVTPEKLKKVELRIAWPLSALAPRMKFLEEELAATNRVRLAVRSQELLEKFQNATRGQDLPVQIGNDPGDEDSPVRVLRAYLPPDEGGIDQPHPFDLQALPGFLNPHERFPTQIYRKQLFELDLTPWRDLPPSVRDLPHNVDPGLRLRTIFAGLFVRFPLPPSPRDQRAIGTEGSQGAEFDQEAPGTLWGQRFAYFFLTPGVTPAPQGEPMVHFSVTSQSPRDDLLRGHYDQATHKLMETLDQVHFQQALAPDEGPDNPVQQKLARWCGEAKAAQAALVIAERNAAGSANPEAEPAREAALKRLNSLWGRGPDAVPAGPSIELPLWLAGLMAAAARPMEEDASYQLALCKQEQAEQAQARLAATHPESHSPDAILAARDAWTAASDLWAAYFRTNPSSPRTAAARLMHARALEALGRRADARSLLETMEEGQPSLEKTGRLYLAHQLGK